MRIILLAACMSMAAPLAARAQPVSEAQGPDTYLQVHLGAVVPAGDKHGLDTGFTFGGIFGARFTRHLAAEAGVAYQRATGSPDSRLLDVPVSASLVLRAPFKQAEVAVYAGPDLHFVRWSPLAALPTLTDTAFGGHAGVRAAFNLWPTTLVGIDAQCAVWEATFGGGGRLTQVDLKLALTLQYRF